MVMGNLKNDVWLSDVNKVKIDNSRCWIHKIPTSGNWMLTNFEHGLTNYNLKTKDYKIALKRVETIIYSKNNYVEVAINELNTFTERIKSKSVKLTPEMNKNIIKFTESIKNL